MGSKSTKKYGSTRGARGKGRQVLMERSRRDLDRLEDQEQGCLEVSVSKQL